MMFTAEPLLKTEYSMKRINIPEIKFLKTDTKFTTKLIFMRMVKF